MATSLLESLGGLSTLDKTNSYPYRFTDPQGKEITVYGKDKSEASKAKALKEFQRLLANRKTDHKDKGIIQNLEDTAARLFEPFKQGPLMPAKGLNAAQARAAYDRAAGFGEPDEAAAKQDDSEKPLTSLDAENELAYALAPDDIMSKQVASVPLKETHKDTPQTQTVTSDSSNKNQPDTKETHKNIAAQMAQSIIDELGGDEAAFIYDTEMANAGINTPSLVKSLGKYQGGINAKIATEQASRSAKRKALVEAIKNSKAQDVERIKGGYKKAIAELKANNEKKMKLAELLTKAMNNRNTVKGKLQATILNGGLVDTPLGMQVRGSSMNDNDFNRIGDLLFGKQTSKKAGK